MIATWSWVTAALATLGMRELARRIGFVNHPNPIVPQHDTAVAYGGGVGLWLGFVVGAVISGSDPLLVLAGTLAALLGLIDDARPFSPAVKLGLQIVPAAIIGLSHAPVLTGIAPVDAALAGFVVLVFFNAVNFTDVCDGLVGGLGAVALLALGLLTADPALLAGGAACLGFLVWNRPSATIYMGDAGSHLVGLLCAVGSLSILRIGSAGAWLAAVVVPGVFLFELVFITAVRIRKGLPWWRGSPDHFSLRMQAGPFSKWQTVLTAWAVGALLAVLGGLALEASLAMVAAVAALVLLLGAVSSWALLRWDVQT